MKRILLVISIIFLIFGFSIPAFAWNFSGNLYDNIAPQEIIDKRPIYVGSNPNTLTFYNPIEEKYYHVYNFYASKPTYEFQSSTGLLLNGAFDLSFWNGSEWALISSDINSLDITDLLLVHYFQCDLNIDGTEFSINSDGYIEIGGVVQRPSGDSGSTDTEEDDDYSKNIWSSITDFFSTFWDNFTDIFKEWWDYIVLTFNDIFVPNPETLSQSVVQEVDHLVSEAPLIGQISTIWRVVFNVMPTSSLELDEEIESGSFSNVDQLFFDLDTYYRIISSTVGVGEESGSSGAPVTYVFSDPSQDVVINVPIPDLAFGDDGFDSSYGGFYPMTLKTSLYSENFVNLDFFGVSIRSARDIVFFFCEIVMWWNFLLILTKFAFNLFSHDPLGAFIGSTNANADDSDAREAEFQDMQMERHADEKRYKQDRFEALQKQKDEYLDKKYLDYRMSHKGD